MSAQINEQLRVDTYEIEGVPGIHMIFDENMYTDEYMTSSITVSGISELTAIRDAINEALGE